MPLNNFPKHQTVAWWIEQLKEMPPDSIVKISDNEHKEYMCMLSIYTLTHKPTTVVLDVGEPENYE